ncbi:MAG: hypothetical protein IJN02_00620 [Bacteroidales bacterium]|nr:hypothetical protein [Bacteroidales bacterium]MBQ6687717.1 hypothetical protein [Bacteroidales bacterium]
MKIRNFIYATMIAVAAMTGCTKENPEDKGNENTGGGAQVPENIEFTLTLESVDKTSAKFQVSHNGTANASWLGFATEDLTTDVNTIIKEKVAEYNGNVTGLKRQNELSVRVSGLKQGTEYRYIVTGCLADGTVYGTAAFKAFTTEADVEEFTVNPAWNVSYVGEQQLSDGTVYEHCIYNDTTDEDNPYIFTVINATDWDPAYLQDILDYEIEYWESFLAYYTQYTWEDIVYVGPGLEPYDLDPGNYIALALGMDTTGNPTGLYAVSEAFEVKEQEATAEYNAWLGTWTMTGANNASFTLTFAKNKNNKSYAMLGYEGLNDLPVFVDYDKATNKLSIIGQYIGQGDFGSQGIGDIYFLPIDTEGYFYMAEVLMTEISLTSEGNASASAGVLEFEDGSTATISFMTFIADINDKYYGISDVEIPTLPATLTKTAEPQSLSAGKTSKEIKRINTRFQPSFKLYYPLTAKAR